MLGGYMAGVTVSGVLWAVFQNNAGGAWDNAKKSFEAGVMINGEMTYKGSDAHKAAVTGDTVGDPFKDTSGPSMNILIKLTCLIGLVIAPILGSGHADNEKAACCSKDKMEMVCKEGKCDLSKCATMTKEECAKMCEDNGCSQECKDNCMSQYDENGKYIGDAHVHGPNCDHDADYEKRHQDNSPVVTQQETQSIQIKREIGKDGKEKATVTITSTVDGKESKTVKVLEGTKAEVDAKIAELDKK
jgi:K(+)-stimulated pyrophosphate-energized sodium pump